MAGIESLLGGFVRGLAQGKKMKFDREREEGKDKLQAQMLKIQLENAKAAAAEKKSQVEFRNLLYNSPKFQKQFGIAPAATGAAATPYTESSGSGTGTPFGESITGGGVSDIMSLAQMNPMIAELMQAASGGKIDFGGAIGTAVRQADFARRGTEKKHVTIPGGGGGSTFMEIPKYGSATGPGAKMLGSTPAPTEFEEMETGGIKYRRIINKATKAPAGKWEQVAGKKGMPAETAGKLSMVSSGLADMKRAEAILLDKDGNVTDDTYRRILEMAVPGGGMPWSKGREAKAYILNAMEGKIRIESGAAVPDAEIARLAVRFMPSVRDSKELIKSKLTRMKAYLSGVVEKLDPAKNYSEDTVIVTAENGEKFALIPKTKKKDRLPASVKSKLKEGVDTEFENGQVWTLQDGEAVRVE